MGVTYWELWSFKCLRYESWIFVLLHKCYIEIISSCIIYLQTVESQDYVKNKHNFMEKNSGKDVPECFICQPT